MRLSLRFTCLLGLALPMSLAAQVFPIESGSAWRGIVYGLAGPIQVASVMCGDTTINTIKYNKFYQINYDFDGAYYSSYYRACTRVEGQKVWVIASGTTQEILLYDFGVEVGDTLHLQFADFGLELNYYAESIEQINVGGTLRKMIRFETSYGIPDFWIEGIGSIMGPLDRGFFLVDAQPSLTCYLKDGDVVYKIGAEQECEGGLTCAIVSSSGEVSDLNAFKVFPNPADTEVWIKSDVPGPIQVEIFTADGRLVSKAAYPDGQLTRINAESLTPGIYLFRIATKDKPFSLKFHRVAIVR